MIGGFDSALSGPGIRACIFFHFTSAIFLPSIHSTVEAQIIQVLDDNDSLQNPPHGKADIAATTLIFIDHYSLMATRRSLRQQLHHLADIEFRTLDLPFPISHNHRIWNLDLYLHCTLLTYRTWTQTARIRVVPGWCLSPSDDR